MKRFLMFRFDEKPKRFIVQKFRLKISGGLFLFFFVKNCKLANHRKGFSCSKQSKELLVVERLETCLKTGVTLIQLTFFTSQTPEAFVSPSRKSRFGWRFNSIWMLSFQFDLSGDWITILRIFTLPSDKLDLNRRWCAESFPIAFDDNSEAIHKFRFLAMYKSFPLSSSLTFNCPQKAHSDPTRLIYFIISRRQNILSIFPIINFDGITIEPSSLVHFLLPPTFARLKFRAWTLRLLQSGINTLTLYRYVLYEIWM